MPRRKFEPTEDQRRIVKSLAGSCTKERHIALITGRVDDAAQALPRGTGPRSCARENDGPEQVIRSGEVWSPSGYDHVFSEDSCRLERERQCPGIAEARRAHNLGHPGISTTDSCRIPERV